MNGKFICQLGELSYKINDKQVVVLKGENLKFNGKKYSCIIRINPPEEGNENPVTIVHLNCKFATSTDFEDTIKHHAYQGWNKYVDKHPSIEFGMKRDVKIKVNKQKLTDLQKVIGKMKAQLEVAEALLKEIDI